MNRNPKFFGRTIQDMPNQRYIATLSDEDRREYEKMSATGRRQQLISAAQAAATGLVMQWLEQNNFDPESLVDTEMTITYKRTAETADTLAGIAVRGEIGEDSFQPIEVKP
jgi:hypothetical protein